jgi:hypothetical protein
MDMTLRKSLIIAMLICLFGTHANAADQKELEAKVTELNNQSIKLLGVSLNAVRYLVGATPNDFLLLSALEESGEINYIRELKAKKYVRLQITQGLPDGTEQSVKFLRVIPIGSGIELQQYVVALQHPALKGFTP